MITAKYKSQKKKLTTTLTPGRINVRKIIKSLRKKKLRGSKLQRPCRRRKEVLPDRIKMKKKIVKEKNKRNK